MNEGFLHSNRRPSNHAPENFFLGCIGEKSVRTVAAPLLSQDVRGRSIHSVLFGDRNESFPRLFHSRPLLALIPSDTRAEFPFFNSSLPPFSRPSNPFRNLKYPFQAGATMRSFCAGGDVNTVASSPATARRHRTCTAE